MITYQPYGKTNGLSSIASSFLLEICQCQINIRYLFYLFHRLICNLDQMQVASMYCYSIVFVVFDLASIRYLCYVFTDILLFLNANMLLMLMPNRDEIGIVQLSANRLTYNSVRSFTSTLKVILLHLMEFLIE